MKKIIFLLGFLVTADMAWSQTQWQYDSSFKELYKEVALHPWHRNYRGVIHDSVIRKWDKDIKIFVEGGNSRARREIRHKLASTVDVISPALGNKIKISFVGDKASSNYVITLNPVGRSGWFLNWDRLDNIYSCVVLINTSVNFNTDQQAALASHYLLKSLGDFVFTRNAPFVASNMRLWRQDINNTDLQILKLHYSEDIKPGMAERDIDKFFVAHGN